MKSWTKLTPQRFFLLWIVPFALASRSVTLWQHVIDVDEASWAVSTWRWLERGGMYQSFVENKPPGVFLFFGAIFSVFQDINLLYVHAATILIVLLTAIVLYKIALLLSPDQRETGYAAALFYVLYSTIHIPKIISTNIEIVMNLPIALGVYCLLRAFRERPTYFTFLCGIAIGIACCLKYQAGIVGVWATLVILLFFRKSVTSILGALVSLTAGALVPLLIVGTYLYATGTLYDCYHWTLLSSMKYISHGSQGMSAFPRIASRGGLILAFWSMLWVLSAPVILGIFREFRNRRDHVIVLLWFFLTTLAIIPGWRLYPHYFLLWLPALSILSAIGLNEWTSLKRPALYTAFVFAALCLVARVIEPEVRERLDYGRDPFQAIAEVVRSQTLPKDHVMVWGVGPKIYYYADRLPAHRFVWGEELMGRGTLPGALGAVDFQTRIDPRAWELWNQDMAKTPPKLIVDLATTQLHDSQYFPISNYPILFDFIRNHYEPVATPSAAQIYVRK